LITRKSAERTKGRRKSVPQISLKDARGQEYMARESIVLTWWLFGTAVTRDETFYLVESCGGYDGVLRANVTVDPQLRSGCDVLVRDRESEGTLFLGF
jgi:hypothetical protein